MWIDNVWHGRAHTWEKVKWVMGVWKDISGGLPFCLKGIQSVEDAKSMRDADVFTARNASTESAAMKITT